MIDITKSIQIALFGLIIGGCSLQTTVPAASKYLLNVAVESKVVANSNFSDKVIRIAQMESSAILSTRNLYYSVDEGRSYSYTRARWIESVPKQLTSIMMLSITKTKIFKDVIPFRSLAKNDLILESSLYSFSQVLHDDGTATLALDLKVRLVEQYSRKIIASKLFEYKVDGVKGNAQGATEGYSKIATELLQDVNRWLEENSQK